MSNACTLNRVCSVLGCGRKHTKFLHQTKFIPQGFSASNTEAAQAEIATTAQSGFTETDTSCNSTGVGTTRVALPIVPVKVTAGAATFPYAHMHFLIADRQARSAPRN